MEVFKAMEKYDKVRADMTTSQDQIRDAGVALMHALRDAGRPFPKGLADEILDANHIVNMSIEIVASGVE